MRLYLALCVGLVGFGVTGCSCDDDEPGTDTDGGSDGNVTQDGNTADGNNVGSDGNISIPDGSQDSGWVIPEDGGVTVNEAGVATCNGLPCACSDGIDNDQDGLVDAADPECTGPADNDESMTTNFPTNPAGQVLCGNTPCECNDGIDNDGDGTADGLDVECSGPADNDEGSFATGISGDNKDPFWQDCFFDGNSGAGNDGCRYHTECLTGERESDDRTCTVSDKCLDFCGPLAPNGCDCFGCCEVTKADGSTTTVVLSDGCSEEELDNPEKCQTCRLADACVNECGECELCLGKGIDDLPEKCFPDKVPDASIVYPEAGVDGGADSGGPIIIPPPPPYVCEDNTFACDAQGWCPEFYACTLGCCIPVLR